jgi:tRNA A37 methylthiotransferase MiaB
MRNFPGKVIMRRMEIISSLIEEKMIERNKKFMGKSVEVLIDGIEEGEYYGRTKTSAPDIDPVVWISPHGKKIEVGNIYQCSITDVLGGDIAGEVDSN